MVISDEVLRVCHFEEVILSQRLESNRGASYLGKEHSRLKEPVRRFNCRQAELCIPVAEPHVPECDN